METDHRPSRLRAGLLRGLSLLRVAWDILGVTVALFALVVLLGWAGRAGARRLFPPERGGPPHPYASEPWRADLAREYDASLAVRWGAYGLWRRRPYRGRWVNVDSAGLRVTPQRAGWHPASREVWFLGGSTMWGTGQRDSATIPAVVAAALADQGTADVLVRNYGETGYVFTQEVLRLMLELRDGARPAVVVFYDGINDAAASAMNGRCGLPQNETRREAEFSIGRFLTLWGLREFRGMARAMLGQAALRDGTQRLTGTAADSARLGSLAHGVVDCYAKTARIVESLSRTYGFRVLYFWQPTPTTSVKPLTPFERAVVDAPSGGGLQPWLRVITRLAAREIDSAMAAVAPGRFVNLGGVFATDSGAVWLDYVGHLTERANRAVALRMAGPIARELAAPPSPARAGP